MCGQKDMKLRRVDTPFLPEEGGGGDVDDGLVVGDSVGPLGQRLSSVRKTPYK